MNKQIDKLVCFTLWGEATSIVQHAIDEGIDSVLAIAKNHDVIYTKDEKVKKEKLEDTQKRLKVGSGLVPTIDADECVKNLLKMPMDERASCFLFFDLNVLWKYSQQLIGQGFPGNFATEDDRIMESDRNKAKDFVKEHYASLKVADLHEFKTVDDAKQFLEGNGTEDSWVLKGNSDDAETVVPNKTDYEKNKAQLVSALDSGKKDYEKGGFILEKKIMNPIELTPQGVWYDGVPVYFTLDIELKKKGAGDLGKQTGCSGNLIVPLDEADPIVKYAFPQKIYDMAKEKEGMFIWDASILIDPKDGGMYFSEFCFDPKTEILLKGKGWSNYRDIQMGDEVFSIDPKTEKVEWKPITKIIIKEHNGDMVKIDSTAINAFVTPEHQFWMKHSKRGYKRFRADNFPKSTDWLIPRVGKWEGNNIPEITIPSLDVFVGAAKVKKGEWTKEDSGRKVSTHSGERNYKVVDFNRKKFYRHTLRGLQFSMGDFCEFLGLWLAEGSFGGYYKGEPKALTIAQSIKSSRRKEIVTLLSKMNLPYKVAQNGTFEINNRRLAKYFWGELNLKNVHADTKFVPFFFKELAPEYLERLFHGFYLGDGSFHKKQYSLFTTSKRLADDLQEIIHKIGWTGNMARRQTKGTSMTIGEKTYIRNHDIYIISTRSERINSSVRVLENSRQNVFIEKYHGTVWDVSVKDNESLFVRREGKAYFSSNCSQRFGWDCIQTEMDMSGGVKKYLESVINGHPPFKKGIFGFGVRVFSESKDEIGIEIENEGEDHVWVMYVYKGKNGMATTAFSEDAYVVTGSSDSMHESIKKAYDVAENNVSMENDFYRPMEDILSLSYAGSLMNRYNYAVKQGLITDVAVYNSAKDYNEEKDDEMIRELIGQVTQIMHNRISHQRDSMEDDFENRLSVERKGFLRKLQSIYDA